ncbi:MAG TPA: protein translocase subunit SecD, partial [Patescibacteria group bacterium]|nr:protein translocase subunit SecD [Patescibacteria group bacterium]
MKSILMKVLMLAGIALIALSAAWIVWPHGSRIDLNKLKIHYHKDFSTHLGLDLQGGSHLVYQADFKDVSDADRADALNAVRDTIERRVNSFGVSEPLVQVQGKDEIVVELPGIKDVNKAIDLIGQTPLLEFRTQADQSELKGIMGPDGKVTVDPDSQWKKTGLTGKQLTKATADIQQSTKTSIANDVVVRLQFDSEGTKLFSDMTTANVGKQIAIFLDGQVLSAPTVQNPITDGTAIITGNFTADSAKELATRLN